MDDEPISYTVANAAKATGLTRTQLYQALQEKTLVGRKLGRRLLIEREALVEFVRSLPEIGERSEGAAKVYNAIPLL